MDRREEVMSLGTAGIWGVLATFYFLTCVGAVFIFW